jgi:hypothetical protein
VYGVREGEENRQDFGVVARMDLRRRDGYVSLKAASASRDAGGAVGAIVFLVRSAAVVF